MGIAPIATTITEINKNLRGRYVTCSMGMSMALSSFSCIFFVTFMSAGQLNSTILQVFVSRYHIIKSGLLYVCSYHVTYAFQIESTLYGCLNVKEFIF